MARNLQTGKLEIPDFVQDSLKYSRVYRSFESRCEKAGTAPDLIDFDQEIYDDKLTDHEMSKRINELCMTPRQYEEVIGVPAREYKKLERNYAKCSGSLQRIKKQQDRPKCKGQRSRREKWCRTFINNCSIKK